MKVMVVDDDLGIRRLAKFILNTSGIDVLLAPHGREALDLLTKDAADVIVLDLNMPVMDGYDFVHNLDETPGRPPIIILSGDRAEIARRELGAEASLRKPFRPDELITKVHEVSSSRSPDSEASAA